MNQYHYHNMRAVEARAKRVFGHWLVQGLLVILTVLGICGGAALVAMRMPLGWLAIGAGVICGMIVAYARNELKHVPVGKGTELNDLLTGDVMSLLDAHPTPQKLAKIIQKTQSGFFLALRFGVGTDLLEIMARDQGEDPTPIFERAREVRQKTNSEQISGGVLAIALIENYPDYENLLSRLRLEIGDLYDGVDWFNHLHGLVKDAKKRRYTGGVARDLSFGYIPTLQHFGVNISAQRERGMRTQLHLADHKEVVSKMVQTFSSGGRQNVALIGPNGCGRSTIVNAFAEELLDANSDVPTNLKFRQVFMLDASALISAAGSERGGLEGLINRVLSEAYAAKNIIICLDNAQLFFEEGTGSVDVTNVLLPIIEAGNLRMILTMEQQRYLEISAKNSSLANALNKIMVKPANESETMKAMQDQVPLMEHKYQVIYNYMSLREAYRLSVRYVHDLEMPGRALNLLEQAASFADGKLVTSKSVQQAVEKTEGVKVQVATEVADREKLLNLETLIHQRMIDQVGAVQTVSDALRRAAAGVRNENRPIGTFLFLGPTGVGKTELAKALSEVYFGGESQIVRLDMNEFVSAADVSRLIADGAEDALSLTAQVMKQPFSVVLLDEIEKAHPQVLTTLLQMLDEGILRDVKNREVSFRDAIVIATSNAGANQIREMVAAGVDLAQTKETLTNSLIASGEFKPEFLNRFDEICIFQPLSKENLVKVVDLIMQSVNKTLAPQKITVRLAEDAKLLLVERGYDPQLGARPMRRIVQQTVENLVAKFVLSGAVGSGAEVLVTREMVEGVLGS